MKKIVSVLIFILCFSCFAVSTYTGCKAFNTVLSTAASDPHLQDAIDKYIASHPNITSEEAAIIKESVSFLTSGNVTVSGTIQEIITAGLAYYLGQHPAPPGDAKAVNPKTAAAKSALSKID